jgi:vacuolar-type H+-ATPase subunit H
LVVVSVVVGIGVILLGDYFNFGSFRFDFDAETGPYWSGVAVNGGTTVVLAGVLIWFERQLTVRVQQARAEATRQIGEARNDFKTALDKVTEHLNVRMDELDERTSERAASAMKEEVESIDRLGADASRDSVLSAMRTAGDLNAIVHDGKSPSVSVIVPGSTGPDGIPLIVAYTPERDGDWGTEVATLRVGRGWSGIEEAVDWSPNMSATDVFDGLRLLLVRADQGAQARRLSPERFFAGLREALDQAVRRRQGNDDFWIQGSEVLESVAPGWLITDLGIEVEGHGVVIGRYTYGHWDWDEGGRTDWINGKTPTRPEGLDEATWSHAHNRGFAHFEEEEDDYRR